MLNLITARCLEPREQAVVDKGHLQLFLHARARWSEYRLTNHWMWQHRVLETPEINLCVKKKKKSHFQGITLYWIAFQLAVSINEWNQYRNCWPKLPMPIRRRVCNSCVGCKTGSWSRLQLFSDDPVSSVIIPDPTGHQRLESWLQQQQISINCASSDGANPTRVHPDTNFHMQPFWPFYCQAVS